MASISIFQIYFDKYTKKHLEKEFIPYFNDKKDGYFENTVIKEIYNQNIQCDYIGISSWKQYSKTKFTGTELISHIQKDIDAGTQKDVYLYTPVHRCITAAGIIPQGYDVNGIIKAPDIWSWHSKRISKIYDADMLLNNSGILPFDIFDGKWIFSYCNYWICRKEIFNEYCEKVLLPAIDFFERPDIKQSPQSQAWYLHTHQNKKYPCYSFVMEGLFGSFLAHSDYTYSYLYKKVKKRMNMKKKYLKVNVLRYERIAI